MKASKPASILVPVVKIGSATVGVRTRLSVGTGHVIDVCYMDMAKPVCGHYSSRQVAGDMTFILW